MTTKNTVKKTNSNGQKPATKNLSASIPVAVWLRAKEVMLFSQAHGPEELTWDSLITRALESFLNGPLESPEPEELERILTQSVRDL